MALTARMLSLVSRLVAPSALNAWSCRFKSRDATSSATAWVDHRQSHTQYSRASDRRPRRPQEMFEEEADLDDVEDKLQKIIDEEERRQRTVKYHKIRRQMTPSGAPERKLSWVSMEQIRYLKQEQPEEWTVERLAEGFSVSPDVIQRVLRSRFNPPPERKAKQDAKVMARLGQQQALLPPGRGQGQDRPQLPAHSTAALLPAGSSVSALVTPSKQGGGLATLTSKEKGLATLTSKEKGLVTLTSRQQGSRALAASPPPDSLAMLPTHVSASLTVPSQPPSPVLSSSNVKDVYDVEDHEEEGWDGEVFLEEDIEELMLTVKHSPVKQVGNEFFDDDGNFLYRI